MHALSYSPSGCMSECTGIFRALRRDKVFLLISCPVSCYFYLYEQQNSARNEIAFRETRRVSRWAIYLRDSRLRGNVGGPPPPNHATLGQINVYDAFLILGAIILEPRDLMSTDRSTFIPNVIDTRLTSNFARARVRARPVNYLKTDCHR